MIIVPAKNILFGEHSVVYPPNSAVIATNSLSCKADVSSNNTSSLINVNIAGEFRLNTRYEHAHLLGYLDEVRKANLIFQSTGDYKTLRDKIINNDDLLKLAIAVVLDRLNNLQLTIHGFNLYLLSQVPLQSGFGSSAVFSSAVIAAILDFAGQPFDRNLIFDLTMEIEAFQHLNPSGEGPAAVIYGDLVKLTKTEAGKPIIEKIQLNNPELREYVKALTIVHSGMPKQATGELVGYVKSRYAQNEKLIEELELNTQKFLSINNYKQCDQLEFVELVNSSGKLLEKLGVVTESVIKYSAKIRNLGGAVKISGAGGRGKEGSGALLVYHNDRELVKKITEEFKYKYYDIEFGRKGLQIQRKT